MEFEDGWVVNLGIGIPTLCSNFDFGDKEIIFHAENGVIGYGPLTGAGREDLHLVNAGGQHVTLNPGAAIVHHAEFVRPDPQRPYRRDRARRLRGRRRTAISRTGRWRDRRAAASAARWILPPAPSTCSSRWSTSRGAASRGSSSAARSRSRPRGVVNLVDHQLRAVRDHAGGHGAARDRARRLGRRDQGGDRLQPADPATRSRRCGCAPDPLCGAASVRSSPESSGRRSGSADQRFLCPCAAGADPTSRPRSATC